MVGNDRLNIPAIHTFSHQSEGSMHIAHCLSTGEGGGMDLADPPPRPNHPRTQNREK